MQITSTPGALKKSRRTPWRFQQTVVRPKADDLERFVSTIVTAHGSLESATVTIDDVVFNTIRTSALCPRDAVLTHDTSILAQSASEAVALLVAAFWDGLDFICLPAPKPFVFYADHEDLITFYANTKSNLNRVVEPLASRGYELLANWQREL